MTDGRAPGESLEDADGPEAWESTPDASTWLVRLRAWSAAAYLALSLYFLRPDDPWSSAAAAAAAVLTAATNLLLSGASGGPRAGAAVRAALLADVACLTAVLAASGGAANPFTVLYIVPVSAAALVAGPRFTWGLVAASGSGYATLFISSAADPHAGHHPAYHHHLRGMLVAFLTAAALAGHSLGKAAAALRRSEREVARLRLSVARQEKLRALSTLAAGAAHELGTPLSSIALAAGELDRSLSSLGADPDVLSDVALIRSEAKRCKSLLARMAGRCASEEAAPPRGGACPAAAAREAALSVRPAAAVSASPVPEVAASAPELVSALTNLVKNGSEAGGVVSIAVDPAGGGVRITVSDTGSGMDDAALRRAGEPFFTTKEPGQGTGLGVFLAREFAERHAGSLEFSSSPGRGTRAVMVLPAVEGKR